MEGNALAGARYSKECRIWRLAPACRVLGGDRGDNPDFDAGVNFAVEFWVDGLDDGPNKFSSDVLFLVWDAYRAAREKADDGIIDWTGRIDAHVLQSGLEKCRSIFAAPALAEISRGELAPGPEVNSVETVREYTRHKGNTLYHPVGTCKMGDDPMAVVDDRLRVHGFQGLRVIDASIMPTLTTGNTNAPTIMIAEKGADMILEDNKAA